jgi:hypothetical protein
MSAVTAGYQAGVMSLWVTLLQVRDHYKAPNVQYEDDYHAGLSLLILEISIREFDVPMKHIILISKMNKTKHL